MSANKWWAWLSLGFLFCIVMQSGLLWIIWFIFFGIVLIRTLTPAHERRNTPLSKSLEADVERLDEDNEARYYIEKLEIVLDRTTDVNERRGLEKALALARDSWPEFDSTEDELLFQESKAGAVYTGELASDRRSAGAAWDSDIKTALLSFRRNVDQTVALLYVGAFLFISAAGLFVAFDGFDGVFKFSVLGFTCAAFYMSGLYLLRLKKSLRPAAVSFVAIGLVLLPTCGVAATSLLGLDSRLSWLLTSLLGILLYGHALIRLRSEIMSYLVVLMWLSLTLSSASLLDAPLYAYAWVTMLFGIVLHLLHRPSGAAPTTVSQPAQMISQLLIPVAAAGALIVGTSETALWQTGVSLVLAGGYYALMARDSAVSQAKNIYAIIAHATVLSGVTLTAYDALDWPEMLGVVLLITALIQVLYLARLQHRPLFTYAELYHEAVFVFASLTSIAALLCMLEDSTALSFALVAVAGLHILLHCYKSWAYYAPVVAVSALLMLPLAVGGALPLAASATGQYIALMYLVLLAGFFQVRHLARADRVVKSVAVFGYILSFVAVFLLSLEGEWWFLAAMQLTLLMINEIISRYEGTPTVSVLSPIYAGLACMGIVFASLPDVSVIQGITATAIITAALTYAYCSVAGSDRWRMMLLWTGALGILAWLLGSTAGVPLLVPSLTLAALSVLILLQLWRRGLRAIWWTLPIVALVIAVQQAFWAYGPPISIAVYGIMWATYALSMAAWLRRLQSDDIATAFSLAGGMVMAASVLIEAFDPHLLGNENQATLVLAIVSIVGAAAFRLRLWQTGNVLIGYRISYAAALTGLVIISWLALPVAAAIIIALIIAGIVFALSYVDDAPGLVVVTPLLFALAMWELLEMFALPLLPPSHRFAIVVALGALAAYVIGRVIYFEEKRSRLLVIAAIVLGIVAWLTLSLSETSLSILPVAFTPLLLAFSTCVLLAEANLLRLSKLARLVPIALLNVALQQLIWLTADNPSWLVYTHLWAVYVAYVAWVLKRQGDSATATKLKFSALAIFSVPTALQALDSPDDYGLLLLAEHVALIVTGVFLKRNYAVYWGVVVSILTVMYMLRSFAYVQLGIIAIALIGYAVYRLSRSDKK